MNFAVMRTNFLFFAEDFKKKHTDKISEFITLAVFHQRVYKHSLPPL